VRRSLTSVGCHGVLEPSAQSGVKGVAAGVLRPAQRGQKPRVEQKGKSWLDPDVQYA
jgi:hypothetical protein